MNRDTGIGCHRTEHGRLGRQHADIGQTIPAHRQRDRQIQHDLARIVAAHRLRRGVNASDNTPLSPVAVSAQQRHRSGSDTTPDPRRSTTSDG